jgi:hypothetical protein
MLMLGVAAEVEFWTVVGLLCTLYSFRLLPTVTAAAPPASSGLASDSTAVLPEEKL